MPDEFACGCSDESRAEAESWLREAMPGIPDEEVKILTGKKKHYKYTVENTGEVLEGEYNEHVPIGTVESLLLALDDFAQKHGGVIQFGIGSDQWCGLFVEFKKNGEVVRHLSIHYDFGMLAHALAKALLILEEEFKEA